MPTTIASDHIGLEYGIDLTKLANSIRRAKKLLESFHKDISALSKKSSITITVNAKQVKKEAKKVKTALQAALSKTKSGDIALNLKAVSEGFGKIGGINQQIIRDYETLYNKMGKDEKRLGTLNNAFREVNSQIAKQSVVMDMAGKNGAAYYNSVSRVARVEEYLTERSKKLSAARKERIATSRKMRDMAKNLQRDYGRLGLSLKDIEGDIKRQITPWNNLSQAYKDVRKEYKNFVSEQAKGDKATQTMRVGVASNTSALREMGITSRTSLEDLKKLNLTGLDYSKVAKLTSAQLRKLEAAHFASGKAASLASERYARLTKRLAYANFQVRQQEGILGDSMRATERWSLAGMKAMMLSQTAWIASGAVIFGVLATIRKGITDFMDFNQGLTDAAAVTQATTAEFKAMEKAAIHAFTNSIMGAKDTTEALKILGQAGMDAREAAVALETIYKVTTATGGKTADVVKFLTTALNVWNISAKDAAKVGNILGAALNYSKLEVEDLGVSFNYVANISNLAGISITDLTATIAVLANAGIKASTIGTGLRGVISQLIAPTDKFKKQLESAGLSVEDVNIRTTNLFTILKRLQDANFDITSIFKGLRRREAASLAAMLNMGSEAFIAMSAALKDTTAIDIMFERSMEGVKNQAILTGHKIQALLIDTLKTLKPVIIGTAKTVQALTDSISQLAPVLVAAGAAMVAWQLKLAYANIATKGLAYSTTLLGKTLSFLSAHPVFAAITGLIVGLTAVKAATDALTTSIEEQLARSKRRIDDLRKLQFLMLDSKKTDEDKLKILADYANDYPQFLKFLEGHTLSLKDVNEAIKENIKLERENEANIKKRALTEKTERLEYLKRYKKIRESLGWIAKPEIKFLIDPEIIQLEADIRKLNAEIAIAAGEGPKVIHKFKWTADMEKAYETLTSKLMSEREKAKEEYLKDLAVFQLTEKKKTDETKEQQAAREAAYRVYQEKIKKIREDEIKNMERIRQEAEKLGAEDARRLLEEANRLLDNEEKLNKALLDIKEAYYDKEWELRKASMKEKFDDEDEYRQWLAGEEYKREKKLLADLIKEWEDYYDKLKILATAETLPKLEGIKSFIEKMKALEISPKSALGYDPSDFASGAQKGWKEATKDLRDEYKIWEDATENTAIAMKDTLQTVFFDGMKNELKSAKDYWRFFTDTVKRYIAEIAASWILFGGKGSGWGGLIGMASSFLPGGGAKVLPNKYSISNLAGHLGGLQRAKMHTGGLASNEMIRILKDKEFVIRDTSVNRMTQPVLDFINRTGRVPQMQAAPVYNNYYYVDAIDPASFDKVLRERGSTAIHDISLGSFAYARNRRDPRVR